MSFMKGLKGLFINQDEDLEESVEETQQTSEAPVEEVKQPPSENKAVGSINDAAFEQISKALEAANMDGFDYFEFARAVDALKNSQPVEKTRFQTVFTTGESMGMTLESLLDSVHHYEGVLNECESDFNESVQQETETRVTAKVTEAESIDKKINELAAQREEINKEMNNLTDVRSKLAHEIIEEEQKIDQISADFKKTLTVFRDRLTTDVKKIKEYVGSEPAKSTEEKPNE